MSSWWGYLKCIPSDIALPTLLNNPVERQSSLSWLKRWDAGLLPVIIQPSECTIPEYLKHISTMHRHSGSKKVNKLSKGCQKEFQSSQMINRVLHRCQTNWCNYRKLGILVTGHPACHRCDRHLLSAAKKSLYMDPSPLLRIILKLLMDPLLPVF